MINKTTIVKTLLLSILLNAVFIITAKTQSSSGTDIKYIYLQEGFEKNGLPEGWNQEFVIGTIPWKYRDGGYQIGNELNGNTPPHAKEGTLNAFFQIGETNSMTTKLITTPINLKYAKKPEIRFWHAQAKLLVSGFNDKLKVYFKNGKTAPWIELRSFSNNIEDWTEVIIPLSNKDGEVFSEQCYVALEGINNQGNGVCIDDFMVVETEEINREIKNIIVEESKFSTLRTESGKSPITKLTLNVAGNTGESIVNQISFTSICTDLNDIDPNEIIMFYSADDNFSSSKPTVSNGVISGNKIIFSNINQSLPTGLNHLWLTVKIKESAKANNIIGFVLSQNDLISNTGNLPAIDLTYAASKKISKSVFFDSFETDKGWNLNPSTSEWQREIPTYLPAITGYPNPSKAFNGNYILGTDITGLGISVGSYEAGLKRNGYIAETPKADLLYYKNTRVNFLRNTNIGQRDTATVDVSIDNGISWKTVWYSGDNEADDRWRYQDIDISTVADKQPNVKIRFTVGPTREEFAGWSIDEFAITGEYITNDLQLVSIENPVSGCGHSENTPIIVKIKNCAGVTSPTNAKIKFTLDGVNFIEEEIGQEILPSETITVEFKKKLDLSFPYQYDKIEASVLLTGDQDLDNNSISHKLIVQPTINLPYNTSFEEATSFWLTKEDAPLWLKSIPKAYIINKAATGDNAFITNPTGAYPVNTIDHLESPCFNLKDITKPVIEFKIWQQTTIEDAALTLSFSIDNGASWVAIQNTEEYDSYWNWYSGNNIELINCDGFSAKQADYITVRHMLPAETLNKECVKFRLTFTGKENSLDLEGFAIDDFKVFDAPKTIKVSQITNPNTSCNLTATENVSVEIINNWFQTINIGENIALDLSVNNEKVSSQEFILAEPLIKGDKKEFTFTKQIDLSKEGDYNITVSTSSNPEIGFYNTEDNNSTTKPILVRIPVANLGDDFSTSMPDTVVLKAGANLPADQTYMWNDNPALTESTLKITTGGTFKVTAFRNGCETTDEITITDLKRDIGITEVLSPLTACGFTTTERLVVKLTNLGNDIIKAGQNITVGLRTSVSSAYQNEILTLTEDLNPTETIDYTFKQSYNLTVGGPNHYFGFLAKAEINDEDNTNDTYEHNFKEYGYPTYDYGVATVVANGISVNLDARAGWQAYHWEPGGDKQKITTYDRGIHKITVYDINNCPATDQVNVILNYTDIKPNKIVTPANRCEVTATENIVVEIINSGSITIPKGEIIKIDYNIDGTDLTQEELVLAEDFLSDGIITHTSNNTVDIQTDGTQISVTTSLKAKPDDKPDNDKLTSAISIFGYPTAAFGTEKIQTKDFPYILDAGIHQSYLWQDNSTEQTLSITTTGIYKVQITDNDICSVEASVEVEVLTVDLTPTLISPLTNCTHSNNEPIVIEVSNKGNYKLEAGSVFNVELTFQGEVSQQQITLTADLLPNSKQQFTLNNTIDLLATGDYNISIETKYGTDSDISNDKIEETVKTFGLPTINLGDDKIIKTAKFELSATSYESYLWSTGSTEQTISVTKTGDYSVTVTDNNGCSNSDEVHITMLTPDIAITEISEPVSKCTRTEDEKITINIKNTSPDYTIPAGTELTYKIKINDVDHFSEKLTVNSDIKPNDTYNYTFADAINFSTIQDYKLTATVDYTDDIILSNNTFIKTIKTTGNPVINLGNDKTIYDPIKLECGAWTSYLWNTGSVEPTITVEQSGTFSVTVTNELGCTGNSEITLVHQIAKLDIMNIISPTNKCFSDVNADDKTISFGIRNSGDKKYMANEKVKFAYEINNTSAINELIEMPYDMPTGTEATIKFVTPTEINQAGSNTIMITSAPSESNKQSKSFNVEIFKNPEPPFISKTVKEKLPMVLESPIEAAEYLWSTSETTKAITVNAEGDYNVQVTDNNKCNAKIEFTVEAILINAINDGKEKLECNLWPNPATNSVNITVPLQNDIQQIYCISTDGKSHKTAITSNNNGVVTLDISNIATGAYNIIIITKQQYLNATFIKK